MKKKAKEETFEQMMLETQELSDQRKAYRAKHPRKDDEPMTLADLRGMIEDVIVDLYYKRISPEEAEVLMYGVECMMKCIELEERQEG